MDNGHRRASKPLSSPQKFRPGGPPSKRKGGALADPLLLSPDVLDDATRRELLQDVMRLRRASPSSMEPSSASAGADSHAHRDKEPFANQLRARVRAGSQSSDDLVTAMAARLKELESKHKAYQSELQELHSKYRQLNDRYQRERQLREEAETAVLTLYDEKESLEQQLEALEEAGSTSEDEGHAPSRQGTPRRRASDAVHANRHASEATNAAGALTTTTTTATTVVDARVKVGGGEEKFDLFDGDYVEGDGEKVAPTHFTNTARPGTLLFSPQKVNVNDNNAVAPTTPSPQRQQQPTKGNRRHSAETVDVALLQKNARILSDYVGWKGVVKHGNQAGIRERDIVRVVIYKNGICVNRGPFRPFGWALCDAFLDDLTEGYYPYEFKEKYPDGFPIEITDRSGETCDVDANGAARTTTAAKSSAARGAAAASASPAFPAEGGQRLGGAKLQPGKPHAVHTLQDVKDDVGYNPVSVAAFLRNVPAQRVTASGQLVPVRSEIAALLGMKEEAVAPGTPSANAGPSNTVKRMAAAEAAGRRAQEEQQQHSQASTPSPEKKTSKEDPPAAKLPGSSSLVLGDLIVVLVRLPDGSKVALHMRPQDTVAAVRREFVAAAPQYTTASYELYQAFPHKCEWSAHQRTLVSLGVEKSCTLMVKRK